MKKTIPTSTNLGDYDTRNPLSFAIWAYNVRAYWAFPRRPEEFDVGYAAGRVALCDSILRDFLGQEHGDVDLVKVGRGVAELLTAAAAQGVTYVTTEELAATS